jgi:hypothetical protein
VRRQQISCVVGSREPRPNPRVRTVRTRRHPLAVEGCESNDGCLQTWLAMLETWLDQLPLDAPVNKMIHRLYLPDQRI